MCKYCELKDADSIGLTDRKHDDLYISKLEDGYYIENEGLTEFKLNYCPECGRNLQKKEPLDERIKRIFISENISVTLLYRNGKIFAQENYHYGNEVIHKEIYRMDKINFDEPDIEYIKRIIFKED